MENINIDECIEKYNRLHKLYKEMDLPTWVPKDFTEKILKQIENKLKILILKSGLVEGKII